eukprot:TRINITY_DN6958_c0_g3_i2.p1 TRINITY_DN6958_c0_g3~~TRINITY_DN6958_c0_g3_i2.p1  ORF type:complete len:396 (+),score=64.84 TRINITY_DN6958_c0_g3_i2:69-1256(+)
MDGFIELPGRSDEDEVSTVIHAYVAVDVAEKELKSNIDLIEEVCWQPFQALLYSPDEIAEKGLPYDQCIGKLLNFVDRHPELRMEPNQELKKIITWNQDKWSGPQPREYLQTWCQAHGFAEACYNVIEQRTPHGVARVAFCGVCVLPHIGVQVAAERSFLSIDEAVENAALMAILYLDGAIPDGSTRLCHVIPVGYVIPLKGTFLFQGLKGQQNGIQSRGGRNKAQALGARNPRPQKRSRTDFSNGVSEDGDNLKNAIQMVKEYCDKAKWQMPTYEFEEDQGEDGGYYAVVSLPPADIDNFKGPKATTSKLAKNLAAEQVWLKLQQLGPPQENVEGQQKDDNIPASIQEETEANVDAEMNDTESARNVEGDWTGGGGNTTENAAAVEQGDAQEAT